jgi:uncharacterized protein
MATLKQLLGDLTKIEGISTAVVVGRDGFVIEGVNNGGAMDTEAVGAIISTGVGTAEVMGKELKVGAMSQGIMEYDSGIIVMSLVGREAVLACVADNNANLGNVRYQIKKRSPDIQAAL